MGRRWMGALVAFTMVVAGCGGAKQTAGTDVVRVLDARQQAGTVVLCTQNVSETATGEHIVDLHSPDGVRNYVHARFPHSQYHRISVVRPNGTTSDEAVATCSAKVANAGRRSADF